MEPNHICKYSGCTFGKDGGKKHYYACSYCDASENWKSMACCKEHYNLYIEEVLAARSEGKNVDTLPDRTDMSKVEVKKLKKRPLSQIKEETEKELKDYADENGNIDINETVDKINTEIDKKQNKKV